MELHTSVIGKYTLDEKGFPFVSGRVPSTDHSYVLHLVWEPVDEAQYYVLKRVSDNREVARTSNTFLYYSLPAVDLLQKWRLEAYNNPLACRYYQPPPTRLVQTPSLQWEAPQLEYGSSCAICLDPLEGIASPPSLPPLVLTELPSICSEAMKERYRQQQVVDHERKTTILQQTRDGREPLLDGADLLFCGHAFHQGCIDSYRSKTEVLPHTFDVPCPLCKASWEV